MQHSIFLAKVMGLYLLILSLALLINANHLSPMINIIFHNIALQFILGMMLLLVGVLLIVSHNVWQFSWVVVITILSWLIFIKGILYLMFPEWVQTIAEQMISTKNWIYSGGMANLIIGLFLCYMGFFASEHKVKFMKRRL